MLHASCLICSNTPGALTSTGFLLFVAAAATAYHAGDSTPLTVGAVVAGALSLAAIAAGR